MLRLALSKVLALNFSEAFVLQFVLCSDRPLRYRHQRFKTGFHMVQTTSMLASTNIKGIKGTTTAL